MTGAAFACAALLWPAGAAAATDTTAPTVSALAASPTSVDTSADGAVVTVTATLTDDSAGVPTFRSVVSLRSPSGKQTTAGTFVALGGDAFRASVKIAAHSETGTWTLNYLYLVDAAGNYRYVYPADLAALGLNLAVAVSGIPDTTPPSIQALAAAPAHVDTGASPAVAAVSATITDDLAGVNDTTDPCSISCQATTQISFVSPSGRNFAVGQFTNVGGDQYTERLEFPAQAEAGTWRVSTLHLIDTAGNERFLFAGDLGTLGLAVTITVTNSSTVAPAIIGVVGPSQPDGQNGWYVSAPTVGFTCSDSTGIAACSIDGSSSASTTLGESAAAQTVSGTVVANTGAIAHASVTGIRVDLTAPMLVCRPATFLLGDAAATVSAGVADSASGPQQAIVSASVSTAAAGAFTVALTGRDLAGQSTTALCPYTVRAIPTVATLTTFQKQPSFTVSWSAASGDTSVAAYDVRYQTAGTTGSFGNWTTWQTATTATNAAFAGVPGSTYCFSARALDAAGDATPWSAYKCTAIPVDDAAAARVGNWASIAGDGFFLGTAGVSSAAGSTLTLPGVQAKRLGILATKCPGCGTIEVLWNGTPLATISLNAATTTRAALVQSTAFATLQTGTLTVRVVSAGAPVEIDGFAVTQRFT